MAVARVQLDLEGTCIQVQLGFSANRQVDCQRVVAGLIVFGVDAVEVDLVLVLFDGSVNNFV